MERTKETMVMKHSCMCLQCGRGFELVLSPEDSIEGKNCPICGGDNIVKHEPQSFFENIFGASGGT